MIHILDQIINCPVVFIIPIIMETFLVVAQHSACVSTVTSRGKVIHLEVWFSTFRFSALKEIILYIKCM